MIGYKLYRVTSNGALQSPYRMNIVKSPIQRAHEFSPDVLVKNAPGVHAVRYGEHAVPANPAFAWAQVRVIGGTQAIASPWAFRAQAILIEKLTFSQVEGKGWLSKQLAAFLAERMDAAIQHWKRWCDIQLMEPGALQVSEGSGCPLLYYDAENGYGHVEVGHLLWQTNPPERIQVRVDVDDQGWQLVAQTKDAQCEHGSYTRIKNKKKRRRFLQKKAQAARKVLHTYVPDVLAGTFCNFFAGIELGEF